MEHWKLRIVGFEVIRKETLSKSIIQYFHLLASALVVFVHPFSKCFVSLM